MSRETAEAIGIIIGSLSFFVVCVGFVFMFTDLGDSITEWIRAWRNK